MIYKNTYGVTVEINRDLKEHEKANPFTGSSLNRKESNNKKALRRTPPDLEWYVKEAVPEECISKEEIIREKSMSQRTKSKIRRKIIAFSQLFKRLSFVTLTFVNKVEDELAVKVLRKFLDTIKKRSKDFQYLWVAEKQTKNETFKDNIHFHIITNKYWDVNRDWKYWLDIQRKNGILPRDENFKPSSAFDVRGIISNNIKGITSYLTKYVTKNASRLKCQVWNCSKKISTLYTGFYSSAEFLDRIDPITKSEIIEVQLDYCALKLIPVNRKTIGLYDPILKANSEHWRTNQIK